MASAELKSQPEQPIFWNQVVSWLRSIPRSAILSMVGPSLLCLFGYFGWLYYGAHNLDMAYYGLKKENIYLTNQPQWLKKTNVLDDVFIGGSLSRLSLMDVKTTEILVRVFGAHHAIRKTHRVEKLAGGVAISVEYRMPVAMVHIPDEDGYLPVDQEGVLLDEVNFSPSDIPQFIIIHASGGALPNISVAGKKFGDQRIEEAAGLCSLLAPLKEKCKISQVLVYPSSKTGKSRWNLEIVTTDTGPKFFWGSGPGVEPGLGEPSTEMKLNQLLATLRDSKQWTQATIDLSGAKR
jgi:hypothetical protein